MANSMFSSPSKPHFFKPILPDFNTNMLIPEAFYSKYLEGKEKGNVAELRSDASSEITWKIKMGGRRLTKGWEDFAKAHNLKVGDILVFRHEGNLLFHVTPLGPSCCEILYSQKDEKDIKDETGKRTTAKKIAKNECSSVDTDFVVPVTAANQRNDAIHLPKGLTTSIGLNKLCKEIVFMDVKGRSSILDLRYEKSSNRFFVRRGWRAFCCSNGHKTGHLLRLILVRNGKTPVLRISPLERNEDNIGKHSKTNNREEVEHESGKEEKNVESLSLADNSSFVVSVTVSNLREDRLYLPKRLSRSNILDEKFHEISLMNKEGRTWTLTLKCSKSSSKFSISRGWKSFCEANGQKAGCTFLFKLVKNRSAPVLLMTSLEENIHKSKTASYDNSVGPKTE